MNTARLIDFINEQHHRHFLASEKFSKGEQGAYRIDETDGQSFVLKQRAGVEYVKRLACITSITQGLKEKGYPVPHYELIGTFDASTYWVQTVLPGQPLTALTKPLAQAVIKLNQLQTAGPEKSDVPWGKLMLDTLLIGGDGYCVHESLKKYSNYTADILARLKAFAENFRTDELQSDGIVHIDFSPNNILVEADTITGVVDWDGVQHGDRHFDLCCLMIQCAADAGAGILQDYLEKSVPVSTIRFYAAHMVLRQLDWLIRFYNAAEVENCLANPNPYWRYFM
jgi:hypothetical protein